MESKKNVHIWSHQGSCSTCLWCSFDSRADCFAFNEPLLTEFNQDESILESIEANWLKFKDCLDYLNQRKENLIVSKEHGWVYGMCKNWEIFKELTLDNAFHIILLRHPRAALRSYLNSKNSVLRHQEMSLSGLENIVNMLIQENVKFSIINADDLLLCPKEILTDLCQRMGIPFLNSMLQWEKKDELLSSKWAENFKKAGESETFDSSRVSFAKEILNWKCPEMFNELLTSNIQIYQRLLDLVSLGSS